MSPLSKWLSDFFNPPVRGDEIWDRFLAEGDASLDGAATRLLTAACSELGFSVAVFAIGTGSQKDRLRPIVYPRELRPKVWDLLRNPREDSKFLRRVFADGGAEKISISFAGSSAESPIHPESTVAIAKECLLFGRSVGMLYLERASQWTPGKQEQKVLRDVEFALSIVASKLLESREHQSILRLLSASVMSFSDVQTDQSSFMKKVEELFVPMRSFLVPQYVSVWIYEPVQLGDQPGIGTAVTPDGFLLLRGTIGCDISSVPNRVFDLRSSNPLVREVITDARFRYFPSLANESSFQGRELIERLGLRSLISIPMKSPEERVIGVLNIYPNQAYTFNVSVQPLLEGVAQTIAAILGISLLKEKDQMLSALSAFEFPSFTQSIDRICDALLKEIVDRMQIQAASLFLVERTLSGKQRLALRASTGVETTRDPLYYEVGEGLTGRVWQEKRSVRIPDLECLDPRRKPISREVLPKGSGRGSFLAVPLFSSEAIVIGVLRFTNKRGKKIFDHLTCTDQQVLEYLSRFVSVYVDAALKYKHLEDARESYLEGLYHEFLSPLDGLLSHFEWIRAKLPILTGDEDLKKKIGIKLDDVEENRGLLEFLVQGIPTLDEELELHFERVSLVTILTQCKYLLNGESNRHKVEIRIKFLGIGEFDGDSIRIRILFYNLLRNSIKYHDPGEINRYVEIEDSGSNSVFVRIKVSDNGLGIPPDESHLIFEKYKRGTNIRLRVPEGSGLGLTRCRNIVRKHGGDIRVKSTGKPTSFEIEFPRVHQ